MRRFIASACGLMGLLFGAGTTDAAAQPAPSLTLNPTPVGPGDPFTVTLENFCPIDDIDTVAFQIEGFATTDAPCRGNGVAIATLTAPSTPGDYVVRASRVGVGIIAATSQSVQGGAPGSEEPLPDTGPDDTTPVIALAGGAFLAGFVLLAAARLGGPRPREITGG